VSLVDKLQPLEGIVDGEPVEGYLFNLPGLPTSFATTDDHIHREPCGCTVIVALRLDVNEPFVAADACDHHAEAMARAARRWKASAGAGGPDAGRETGEVMLGYLREEVAR
jgi:hypothetical protein